MQANNVVEIRTRWTWSLGPSQDLGGPDPAAINLLSRAGLLTGFGVRNLGYL